MIGYPKWFNKTLISISMLLLGFSGFLLIPNSLIHRFDVTSPFELVGSLRLIITAIHIISLYLGLFILGAISVIHVKNGLKKNKNRIGGMSLLVLFFLLCVSSIGILYAGSESLISVASAVHIIAGLILIFVYLAHVLQNS